MEYQNHCAVKVTHETSKTKLDTHS